uniref:Uncharacterized protein n=1 Tax=Pyricularia oryzae (strain P131) TaxID=1143193 RepID=L7J6F4_PYRO1
MIYPNEIKKSADYSTRGRPHPDKCSASPIWRLAVERVVDQADDLIVLAEVGGLDYPTGIAKKSQRSIARATRVLAPFSQNLPTWKLIVDFAALLAVLFSFQYHLEPLDLLLASVLVRWVPPARAPSSEGMDQTRHPERVGSVAAQKTGGNCGSGMLENSRFHGREDALQAIAIALSPGQPGCGQLRSFVLFGIGGVGKTEIAHQYVAQHRKDYSTIFWVNASNLETLRESFEEIAQLVETEVQGPQSPMTKVHNWLNDTVDGADDLEILENFWPGNGRGSVLITTRDHTGAQERGLDLVHNVRPFKPTESGKFLLNSIGMYNPSPDDQSVANSIACRLGHLPLTLKQASGFIVRRQLSLSDFMYKYRLQPDAEEIDELKSCGGYPQSVASVWEDTFSKIPEKSLLFLNILAFMRPKGVKEEVLYRGSVLLRKAHPEMGRESWKLMLFMNESMEMSEAQEVLLKWGLISRDPQAGFVSMLRAVRQQTMRRLRNDEREHFSFIAREMQRLMAEKEEEEKAGRTVSGFAVCMQKQQPRSEKLTAVRPPAPCGTIAPLELPRGKTLPELAAAPVAPPQGGDCQRVPRPSMMRADMTAPPLKRKTLADFVAFMATQPPGGRSSVPPAVKSTERARAVEAMARQINAQAKLSRPSSPQDQESMDSDNSKSET